MLDPESLAAMRTLPAGVDTEYGMGWMVMENGNTLAHGGALEYFQSFVALGLKEEIGFVTLYNQNSMENMLFENNTIRDGLLDFSERRNPTANFLRLDRLAAPDPGGARPGKSPAPVPDVCRVGCRKHPRRIVSGCGSRCWLAS